MKAKFIAISAICALALTACESRLELVPVANEGKITAYIDNSDSKTAYDAEGKFSWVEGDAIALLVYKAADGTIDQYSNWADASGAKVTFSGTTPNETYPSLGYALYGATKQEGNISDGIKVSLPSSIKISGTGDMSHIALIGVQDIQDPYLYKFKTAVGVLKVTLANMPVEARKVVLTAPEGDVLAGVFALNETTAASGFEMAKAESPSNKMEISFSQQTAGSTLTVYFPLPVGTVKAGATISVLDSEDAPIMTSKPTVKDIPVTRNSLLDITKTPISVESWVSLGTGKYLDDHGFYYLSNGQSLTRTAADYVDVEIQQKSDEPNKYRVGQPYGIWTSDYFASPADYLYITIREDIGPGIVLNDSYRYNNGSSLLMDNPYWWNIALYHNNRVIKYASDGVTPANIQLAQKYFDIAAGSDCSDNPKIEIVFPGSEPMLADNFNYAYYATASFAAGKVSAELPSKVTAIKVVACQALNDGVEVLEAGTSDSILTFTESGSKDLELEPGSYILVFRVENEGHGYVYKCSSEFEVKALEEGAVKIAAISASNDAAKYDGTGRYDGGGALALIDGDTATYWHSSYYDGYEGYYSYKDLDATYGLYIDLDLGDSKTVTNFSIKACLRANAGAGFPKHVKVYGSTDGQNWGEPIGEVADLKGAYASGDWVDPIGCATPAPIRYIRVSIVSNSLDADLCDVANANENCYTHLAELVVKE